MEFKKRLRLFQLHIIVFHFVSANFVKFTETADAKMSIKLHYYT